MNYLQELKQELADASGASFSVINGLQKSIRIEEAKLAGRPLRDVFAFRGDDTNPTEVF